MPLAQSMTVCSTLPEIDISHVPMIEDVVLPCPPSPDPPLPESPSPSPPHDMRYNPDIIAVRKTKNK